MSLLKQRMREYEKALIEKSLSENNGNRSHAAVALGISRRALLNKIKALGIEKTEPAASSPTEQ